MLKNGNASFQVGSGYVCDHTALETGAQSLLESSDGFGGLSLERTICLFSW